MYPYIFFDQTMVVLIPAILLTLYAQGKVKNNFSKYLQVQTRKNYTGAQVARILLNEQNLSEIPIEITPGHMSDHYDPVNKILRLSKEVYAGSSIASVSVAAHEVGHAIQHDKGYVPLEIRNKIFPIASFGSSAAWFFIFVGFLIPALGGMIDIGILLFSIAVFFQVITLPVEFNASNRAMSLLAENDFITVNERVGAKKVLNAAALTYVAAMAAGIAQLIRLILIRDRRR